MGLVIPLLIVGLVVNSSFACRWTPTTVSGSKKPASVCSGQLIFEDNFDWLDQSKWQHETTLGGGGNWEFQWYLNHRDNSFTKNGNLHIKPRLTSDYFGEAFLWSGRVVIPPDVCTNAQWWGCDRQGTPENYINPIRSARLRTLDSFSFKYGTLEVRAKLPAGDWLWPAIWLLPSRSVYGIWPASGEIDLMESRGNRNLYSGNVNVGSEQVGSTLHFGPRWDANGWSTAHYEKNNRPSFSDIFHTYKMVWTPDYIQFFVDNRVIGTVDAGEGFWKRGNFQNTQFPNPWARATKMAPFDQEFHLIINLAVGGVNYFADSFRNAGARKPWSNSSPHSVRDFWQGKSGWLPTWNYSQNDDADLKVDYVRVWAL
jgi:beta-glucanase (GH16 family)